jgi:uncharacterized protein (DUF433 family)
MRSIAKLRSYVECKLAVQAIPAAVRDNLRAAVPSWWVNRYDEDLNPRITVEAGKMGGKPCIRGLRFTVYDVASYLASGMSEDEILRDFPYLEKEDFQAVYEFFASIPERITILEASR